MESKGRRRMSRQSRRRSLRQLNVAYRSARNLDRRIVAGVKRCADLLRSAFEAMPTALMKALSDAASEAAEAQQR